jgi:hypothetical protein
MNREKFPEKVCCCIPSTSCLQLLPYIYIFTRMCILQVPFRLTRMLVKAMEVSGIEGNFRSTCENVMQVLRTHKDSVMAMMEVWTTRLFC